MLVKNLCPKDIKIYINGHNIVLKAQATTPVNEKWISRKDLKATYGRNILILGENEPVKPTVTLTEEEEIEVKDAIKDIILALTNASTEHKDEIKEVDKKQEIKNTVNEVKEVDKKQEIKNTVNEVKDLVKEIANNENINLTVDEDKLKEFENNVLGDEEKAQPEGTDTPVDGQKDNEGIETIGGEEKAETNEKEAPKKQPAKRRGGRKRKS